MKEIDINGDNINEDDINSSDSSSASNNLTDHTNIEIYSKELVTINNIQEESSLINYTNNHFTNKLNNDFKIINQAEDTFYFENIFDLHNRNNRSNSPITISNYGSDNSNDSDSNSNSNNDGSDYAEAPNKRYKNLTYHDIEKTIDKYYDDIDNRYSNELDIMTTYIRGQKNLYIQAKYITQKKLNYLIFPSIFLTAFITIIAPFIECQKWSGAFISAINATIAFFISLNNYLKLESSSEMYLQMANHYDKIETSLELTNSKLLFLDKEKDKKALVLNKIKDIEKKMNEIKETNKTLIPEEIKLIFPIICNINIFSFIKKIEIYKKNLIIKFKDIKNEIRYILHNNANIDTSDSVENNKTKNRLFFLYQVKDKIKTEFIDYRNAYGYIDDLFTKEIKCAESKKNNLWTYYCYCIFYFFDTNQTIAIKTRGVNPIVDKYFDFIFVDE
jgi:hypothetical protein